MWGVWVVFNLLLLFIYPTFIAPLFNKFPPLEDDALKARIEALLNKCGFTAQGLFVMDGSKRSTHGNAYFTGFGKTKRIVFFDTLLQRLTPDEIDAVLAHELGHFKRRHVMKRIAVTFALSLAFLWLLAQLMQAGWFYQGWASTHAASNRPPRSPCCCSSWCCRYSAFCCIRSPRPIRASTSSRRMPMPRSKPTRATWSTRWSSCIRTMPPH